jgi:hypothetical protein
MRYIEQRDKQCFLKNHWAPSFFFFTPGAQPQSIDISRSNRSGISKLDLNMGQHQ